MILHRSIKQFYCDNKEQIQLKYIIRIREAKNNDLGKWETIQKSGTTNSNAISQHRLCFFSWQVHIIVHPSIARSSPASSDEFRLAIAAATAAPRPLPSSLSTSLN